MSDADLMALMKAIVAQGDAATRMLAASPALAMACFAEGATRHDANAHFIDAIRHYVYAGDTALHVAAAAYRDAMARELIAAGADPNATDKSGVAPLHRAVRTRCAAAVKALIAGGADPRRPNKNGSTPLRLAMQTTGRGGSGSPAAKAEQAQIVALLRAYGDG